MALTSVDLNHIENIIDSKIANLPTLDEVKVLIAGLPSKDEFYEYMDILLGHYKRTDEELTFLGEQVRRNTDDIRTIKQKVGI